MHRSEIAFLYRLIFLSKKDIFVCLCLDNTLKNTIFSRLVVKSTLSVILLISGVTIILATFFVLRMRTELITERLKAAQSLAQNCAYNSRNYILKNEIYKEHIHQISLILKIITFFQVKRYPHPKNVFLISPLFQNHSFYKNQLH